MLISSFVFITIVIIQLREDFGILNMFSASGCGMQSAIALTVLILLPISPHLLGNSDWFVIDVIAWSKSDCKKSVSIDLCILCQAIHLRKGFAGCVMDLCCLPTLRCCAGRNFGFKSSKC